MTIPKPERDRTLLSRLVQELPGILAWAVRGCLDFTQGGLADPPEVLAATESYRSEMDIVGGFIADRCVVAGHARAECGALYAAYTGWCEENGEHAVSQRRFGQQLEERGFGRRRSAQGKWCRSGIGLLDGHDHSDPGAPPAPDDAPPGAPGAPGGQAQAGAAPPPAPPVSEQQVIQVTQGDPTFGVAAESQPAPPPITPPRVDWAYIQRLLSIGDERALAAINVHCELTGVAVEQVLATARRHQGNIAPTTTRAPPGDP